MKAEPFSGTVENAYGEKLATPVKFTGTFQAYETAQEVKDAKDELSDEEIVTARNAQRKANARQKAMTEALEAAGISKPDPNSAEQIEKTLVNTYLKAGLPKEMATQFAAQAMKQAAAIKASATT